MPPIDELTRIEPVYLGRLEKQGVFTTGILLEVSETPTRRQTLADHVGASILEVLTWRDEALMLNLAAFGPGEHILLAQAGFPGLESILDVDLETFIRRVDRAAADMKVTPPAELTMTGWWEQARTLETPTERVAGPDVDVAGAVLRCLIGAAIGAGGAAVAALAVPSGPPGAQVLVVVLILGITGFVGRLAARGTAGFVGLVTAGLILLGLLLGDDRADRAAGHVPVAGRRPVVPARPRRRAAGTPRRLVRRLARRPADAPDDGPGRPEPGVLRVDAAVPVRMVG